MQNRSDLYKKMMKSDLRDITDAVIYIGAINQDAQSGAMVEGSFWKYADLNSPLQDEIVSNRYFSWEEKRNRLDGSMFLFRKMITKLLIIMELLQRKCVLERITQKYYSDFP